MQKKDILKIITLVAFSFGIVSLLTPIYNFDYSDVFENQGYQPPEIYWTTETGVIFRNYKEYIYNEGDEILVYSNLRIFYIISFPEGEKTDFYEKASIYNSEKSYDNFNYYLQPGFAAIILIAASAIFGPFLSYFIYKGMKIIGIKKTNYLFYATVIVSIIFIISTIYTIYYYDLLDSSNLGFVKNIKFGYGFYSLIISIILFLTVHIIQRYFMDIEFESNIIRKEKS